MTAPYRFTPQHMLTGGDNLPAESAAAQMEATGDYRILRRLTPQQPYACTRPNCKQAAFLDVETTGLDDDDEIIELAIVPFQYSLDGVICGVGEVFDQFNEPARPISEEITRLTGITPEMVRGQAIDKNKVRSILSGTDLIIAHNAAFDRPKCEAFMEEFAARPWACSLNDIDWRSEGHESAKLSYLAVEYGFFYSGHRADIDCHAGIKLLTMPLATTGQRALSCLLISARKPGWRVFAVGADYASKDTLKKRGYRWAPAEALPHPKCWWIDIDDDALEDEMTFLGAEVYKRPTRPPVYQIDALNRYSRRIG
jgi:DNA polymerase III subunit epsilon